MMTDDDVLVSLPLGPVSGRLARLTYRILLITADLVASQQLLSFFNRGASMHNVA